LYRWTQRYAPELEKRSAWHRSRLSFSWRVDETYVRVKGRWKYLYRAIDKDRATLDFYLTDRGNAEAAKRFLSAALKSSRDWIPLMINTDESGSAGTNPPLPHPRLAGLQPHYGLAGPERVRRAGHSARRASVGHRSTG
jgi:transposase-like protein